MPKGIYKRKEKETTLCNLCGIHPKYPRRGLCKKCSFSKEHDKWVASRPPKKPIPNLQNEVWEDIKEATGYQVGNMGRIKSLNKHDEIGRHHLLKLREARKDSYLKVDLDKYNWRPSVHRLVALYFVPNPENKPFVNHKDGNKQNNVYHNLEWVTRSENNKHACEVLKKTKTKEQRLKHNEVLYILISTETVQSLCIKYNVSATTIWGIKTGRTWNKITKMKKTRK